MYPDSAALRRPQSDVRPPAARNEAQLLVELVHARISAAALQQHVVAIRGPRLRERGANHGAAMTKPAKDGMSDHVLEKSVAPAFAEQIRRGDQHARRRDPLTCVGHENINALPLECFSPQPFRTLEGLGGRTDLRRGKQLEQRVQVGGASKTRASHFESVPPPERRVETDRA